MASLVGFLGFLLILGVIIVVHELGHFLVAKLSGMTVYEYSLGMGPLLLKVEWHGTQYSLRAVPFGGFVRIAGMDPDEEPTPGDFNSRPFLAKFLTILAGVTMNFILAILIFVILGVAIGTPKSGKDVIIGGVMPNEPADRAGLQLGDRVLSVSGQRITSADQVKPLLQKTAPPVVIDIERQGQLMTINVTPSLQDAPGKEVYIGKWSPDAPAFTVGLHSGDRIESVDGKEIYSYDQADLLVNASKKPVKLIVEHAGILQPLVVQPSFLPIPLKESFLYRTRSEVMIGVSLAATSGEWERIGLQEAVVGGWKSVIFQLKDSAAQFLSIAMNRIPVRAMSGPLGIAQISYKASKSLIATPRLGWASLLGMMAFFSVAIGFFNLLPFPALDGSRLVGLAIEAISRRPFDRKKEAFVHMVGLAILLSFVLFITVLDVNKMIRRPENAPVPPAASTHSNDSSR